MNPNSGPVALDNVMYGDDPDHVSYYYGNYDALHGTIPISDDVIQSAPPFDGWRAEFLAWPSHLWHCHAKGVPCLGVLENAYHVRYLANEMRSKGSWIGEALTVNYGTRGVIEGSHRMRAWRFLATTEGLVLSVSMTCRLDLWQRRIAGGQLPWIDPDAPPPSWYFGPSL